MVVVVIDGVEKAGKSTLIDAIRSSVTVNFCETKVRKWGKLDDGRWAIDSVYAEALIDDSAYEGLVLWDRSWASETVYGQLLHRSRRLADDPWLGGWLYGRGVSLKFILGGPHPDVLREARTTDDLPVDPEDEQAAFIQYGKDFGWHVIGHTDRDRLPLDTLVRLISVKVVHVAPEEPRKYCGPRDASVVFVGERGSFREGVPGGWLPFSSPYTTHYGRILGPTAFRVGWTNAWDDCRSIFQHAKLIVACGSTAYDWAKEVERENGRGRTRVEKVPHPGALYRWGKYRETIPTVENTIRAMVSEYL